MHKGTAFFALSFHNVIKKQCFYCFNEILTAASKQTGSTLQPKWKSGYALFP